jgi:uncharacterized NAD-dependent epimerase/dehydratase family protein
MPENRDKSYPTANKMLHSFQSDALVIVHPPDGREKLHYPKLRPVPQRIWDIMQLSWPPVPTLDSG